jgi:hypothetical protein
MTKHTFTIPTSPEQEANARLMAAAPDGLAFARAYLDMALDVTAKGPTAKPTVAQLNKLYDMARAYVAKAEGK